MSVRGVGDDMLDKIRAAGTDTRRPTTAPPSPAAPVRDEDGWIDDGRGASRPARRSRPAPPKRGELTPLGAQKRRNGATYQPRDILGVYEDVALLRDARTRKEHVLFSGPPGTGKTALAEAAFAMDATAEHDGLETIVGTADTTEADFVGTFVQDPSTGAFTWRPGPLHRSVLYNVPLLVDEIAQIDPRVLSVLYPLMDGRNVLRITANPELAPIPVRGGWFVIGTYNPDVPGATMSEALRDRFEHHIEVGSDWTLARELGVPSDIIEVAKNLDLKRVAGEITWSPQLRTLLSYGRTELRYGKPYALANLLSKAPPEDRDVIRAAVVRKFGMDLAKTLKLGRRFTA